MAGGLGCLVGGGLGGWVGGVRSVGAGLSGWVVGCMNCLLSPWLGFVCG